jgi:diacylglycerol kinase family enzyme
MNAIVVLNSKAGSALPKERKPSAHDLRTAFAQLGINIAVFEVEGAAVSSAVRAALERQPDAIVAAGGDGTISAAAGILVNTAIPLGPLPLGTLNHFSSDLGLPTEWRDAVRALSIASPRRVDVAEMNGRVFLNNCSLGSYGEAVKRRERLRRERGHSKARAMVVASWMVFRKLRRLRFHIELAGSSYSARSPFALVSNNRYSAHVFENCLRPSLNEGRLCVYTARTRTRWSVIRLLFQSIVRNLDEADDLDVRETDRAVITVTHGPLHVACDGELVDVTPPLRFRILPSALCVLAPPLPAK